MLLSLRHEATGFLKTLHRDSSSVMLLSAAMISTIDDSYVNFGSPRILCLRNPSFSRAAKAPPANRNDGIIQPTIYWGMFELIRRAGAKGVMGRREKAFFSLSFPSFPTRASRSSPAPRVQSPFTH